MNPEIELIIKARNEASLALRRLQRQFDKLGKSIGDTEEASRKTSKNLRHMGPILLEVNRAASLATRGFLGVGRRIIGAAAAMETYENTVRVFSDTQAQANSRIRDLIEFSKELVGLETGDIISYFGRLTEAGLSEERAIQAIKGFTEAISEQGKGVDTARRVLEQFFQAVSTSKIYATDFKTIFREVPQLPKVIEKEFGKAANTAQEFREIVEDLGITATESFNRLIPALESATKGADLNTLNAQLDILQDQAFVTAAQFGDVLVPAVVDGLKAFNNFLQKLQDLDADAKKLIVTIGVAGATGATLVAGFTAVALAVHAMNAALAVSIGVTGFAGLKMAMISVLPFLGKAGLVVGGIVAVGYALHKLNEISSAGRVEVRKTSKEYEDLTKEIIKNGKAVVTLSKAQIALFEKNSIGIQLAEKEFNELAEGIKSGLGKGLLIIEEGADSVDKVTKSARNLTLELVKADTALRRARRSIGEGDASTIEVIKQQTQAEVDALEKLAMLEIENAREKIEDKKEQAARIREIQDQLSDDIYKAEKRGLDRIKAYEDSVYEARVKAGQAFLNARKRQVIDTENIFKNALAAEEAYWQADEERERERIERQKQEDGEWLRARNARIDQEIREERAIENARKDFTRNEEFRKFKILNDAVMARSNVWRDELHTRRQMEIDATLHEYDEIKKREIAYRQYFNYINRLNLQSKEQFIQSAVQITAAIIRQTLIQKAVESAASGNFIAAIGFGTAAFATSGIEAIISNALQGRQQESRTRTFHNAMNDSLVETAVSRALTQRQSHHQEFMDNRQQAKDVTSAVDRGIRTAPETQGGTEVFVVNLNLEDRTLQRIEVRRDEMRHARRI